MFALPGENVTLPFWLATLWYPEIRLDHNFAPRDGTAASFVCMVFLSWCLPVLRLLLLLLLFLFFSSFFP